MNHLREWWGRWTRAAEIERLRGEVARLAQSVEQLSNDSDVLAAENRRLLDEHKNLTASLHLAHLNVISVRQRLVSRTRYVRELEEWKARFDRRRR